MYPLGTIRFYISHCSLVKAIDCICMCVLCREGFFERCVMNNYFGIGIDAKISLDFHLKREEHPEKCRSRARNYMWYGVLGSKEWLQVMLVLHVFLMIRNPKK